MVQPTRDSIPVLDGVRGFAALIVAVSHGANAWADGAYVGQGAGQVGVMLFFVLSGFLMGYLYFGDHCSKAAAQRFVLNRIGRVVPLFYTVVIFSYAVQALGVPLWAYPIHTPRMLLEHLSFVRGVDVLWSIGPEMIYYALFLVGWWLWLRHRAAAVVFAIAVLVLSLIPGIAPPGNNSLSQLHAKLPYFLAGTLIGATWTGGAEVGERSSFPGLMALLMLVLLLASLPQVLLLLQQAVGVSFIDLHPPWQQLWSEPYYFTLVVGFFVVTLWARPRWLESVPLHHAGRLSYAIYLVHMLVLMNVPGPAEIGWPMAVMTYGLGTLVLSELVHRIVERPLRRRFRTIPMR